MYLVLEAKGKGKMDTIDHVAVSLGELFAGKTWEGKKDVGTWWGVQRFLKTYF